MNVNNSQNEDLNRSDDNENHNRNNDSQIIILDEFHPKTDDDELYARRLQDEEEKNYNDDCKHDNADEAYAKRLALELREERFAETMQALEEAQMQMEAEQQEQIHYVKGADVNTTTGVEQPIRRKTWLDCCKKRSQPSSSRNESFWNVVLITMIATFLVVLFLIFFSPIGRMVGFQTANCSNP